MDTHTYNHKLHSNPREKKGNIQIFFTEPGTSGWQSGVVNSATEAEYYLTLNQYSTYWYLYVKYKALNLNIYIYLWPITK